MTDDVTLAAGVNRFSGDNVTFAVGDFSTEGSFAVERSTLPGTDELPGTADDETEILVGASGLDLGIGRTTASRSPSPMQGSCCSSTTTTTTRSTHPARPRSTASRPDALRHGLAADQHERRGDHTAARDRRRHAHARRARGPVLPPLRRRERPPRRPRQQDRRHVLGRAVGRQRQRRHRRRERQPRRRARLCARRRFDDLDHAGRPDRRSGLHVRRGHVARPRLLRPGGGQRRLLRRRRERERLVHGLGRRQRRTTRRSASSATT